ncbi:MAG: hypothetical protein CGU28_05175 [Candidatus Dactylopiibacterium carminicum]|uniref:Uncharacterized protein n=1 Tax=Candidatus Dactylopiibacterium carminicum TaxID=857335 RepID=A0A272ETW7_9RHOO|nr:hypothetical protein [Candidatus Dactylopiibacterium carminicum]KAF7599673.1 hypothetical protein BGI27_06805 [Candidatus Dactylopiibacterium carminicum]PAS93549.1 MAG: hypothetical protein CGU29_07020 [Candidatus Dactylopiibacterium carminicum]PAS97458.1 MAG: hypothetical protein CGU28_05175 [Candidatus Dactylopiibacterium carminicum]PAS99671.1 MAG: hypothetical protein BSR46_06840 [Candidatus Dactylopiibacterium carminicum]
MSAVYLFLADSGLLRVCTDVQQALAAWQPDALYFDAEGEPLRRESSGKTFLRLWASCSSCRLEQVLGMVDMIEGELPPALMQAWQALREGRAGV